jgi:hypothetical protein
MNHVSDLIVLLALAGVVGAWLKFTQVRERAVDEARRQCSQHGLQLLDETVGLRSLRWRRVGGGRRFELGYAFEVSAHGDDRLEGRLWMHDERLVGLSLPSVGEHSAAVVEPWQPALPAAEPRPSASPAPSEPSPATLPDNVIPLRPRRPRTGQ